MVEYKPNPPPVPAARLHYLRERATDGIVALTLDELIALEDRLTYTEAAIAHLCDRLAVNPHELPDPHAPAAPLPPVDAPEIPF